MGDGGILDKPLLLLSDLDLDLTVLHPSEFRMEMESAIEDAVETAEDILVRMQMLEPERMMEQYCQSINETATESAKTVKNGVLNIFSKIMTNVSGATSEENESSMSYPGQNPFMIDLVLRNIFQYLDIPDLSSCRLVCKLWNTEAGAYVRRKHRIVFSPNCIVKMANFTALMKAQNLDEKCSEISPSSSSSSSASASAASLFYELDGRSTKSLNCEEGDCNDNFTKPHPHLHQYYDVKDKDRNEHVIVDKSISVGSKDRSNLPPYTDFSFTAQFPRINFSRPIVCEFSGTYGQYVKKLEIFFPNDSNLTAKDFRNFFIRGMPNVQSVHFVNLPMKLTQAPFLKRERSPNCNSRVGGEGEHEDEDEGNRDNSSSKNVKVRLMNSETNASDNFSNCNNNGKDNGNTPSRNYSHPTKEKDIVNEVNLEEEEEKWSGEDAPLPPLLHPPDKQDCFPKWNSLTRLKIDRTLLIEVSWSESFLNDLFRTLPNVKHYELWTWNSTQGDSHSNPYFTCLTQLQRESLISLCPGSIGENLLKRLADYGLSSLRKLYLPVMSGEVSAQSVETLLMNLRGTLQELQVNCSSLKDNARMIHFPRMEKLVSLHMIISVPWKNVYTLFTPSIEYQNQFPQLETLKLELAVYHDFGFIHYFFPCNGSVCRTLNELDISFSGYRDEKFIGILSKIFPNLTKLRLDGYGNRILASICLYLQNLQYFEMFLIYGFNVDDQLTGIDRKVCNEIKKSGRMLEFNMDEVQVLPSLANLSMLKTLKIKQKDYQAKFWPQAQCITDITAYFALAKIKTLRHLHIESVKFSPECRQYLASALEDCWLDFL